MDELIKSIENFRVSNDSEKFDADLDDVITKLNQQDLLLVYLVLAFWQKIKIHSQDCQCDLPDE